jgi:hypothetical protein
MDGKTRIWMTLLGILTGELYDCGKKSTIEAEHFKISPQKYVT